MNVKGNVNLCRSFKREDKAKNVITMQSYAAATKTVWKIYKQQLKSTAGQDLKNEYC